MIVRGGKMKYFSSYIAGLLLCALLFVAGTTAALANGTEQLGPPQGVTIAAGSGLVAAGTGMLAAEQPGEIDLTVPDNAVIKQVLLYCDVLANQFYALQQKIIKKIDLN